MIKRQFNRNNDKIRPELLKTTQKTPSWKRRTGHCAHDEYSNLKFSQVNYHVSRNTSLPPTISSAYLAFFNKLRSALGCLRFLFYCLYEIDKLFPSLNRQNTT